MLDSAVGRDLGPTLVALSCPLTLLAHHSSGMPCLLASIGGMTLAVMMRATMGHTGRELVAGPWLAGAFVLLVVATGLRAALADAAALNLSGLTLAAIFWTAAFGIFALRVGPWLLQPQAAKRHPN